MRTEPIAKRLEKGWKNGLGLEKGWKNQSLLRTLRNARSHLHQCFYVSQRVAEFSLSLLREQTGLNAHGERMVLLLSTREQVIQLLQEV